VAKKFGTPRRTVLLEGGSASATVAAVPLEVADDPCVVLMSASGLVARVASRRLLQMELSGDGASGDGASGVGASGGQAGRVLVPPLPDASRAAHDAVVSAVRATARGTVGLVTSAGRLVKLDVLELPAMPPARARCRWRGARR